MNGNFYTCSKCHIYMMMDVVSITVIADRSLEYADFNYHKFLGLYHT